MSIEVRIPTILRSFTGGASTVTGSGATLATLFDDLEARFPGLLGKVVNEDGSLRRFVNVYVNDEDVRFLDALETPLNPADSVTILPAVAGGAFGLAAAAAISQHRVALARAAAV